MKRASLWIILSTAVMNLSMLAYHRVMSGRLGDAYGELSALMAVNGVLGVLALGASTTLVKRFAEDDAAGGGAAAKGRAVSLLPVLGRVMLAAAAVLCALTPLAERCLRLDGAGAYLTASAVFVLNLGLLLARAALQGTRRFGALGLSITAEGLGGVAFAAALVSGGAGAAGALGGILVGQLAGLLVCLAELRALGPGSAPGTRPLGPGLREMAGDAALLGLFSLLVSLDLFVVKHRLDAGPAALYARAALVAKSFLYLTAALNMVLLPAVSAARARGEETRARTALRDCLGAALLLELAGLAAVWAFTPFVIALFCGGESFQVLGPLIRLFSAAVVPLALAQPVLYYLAAARDYRALRLLAGTAAAYSVLLHHAAGDPARIVLSLGLASAALLAGTLLLAFGPSNGRLKELTS